MAKPYVPVARDIMITSVTVLKPEMKIFDAVSVLMRRWTSGAPVVDTTGKLVGMLSEADCMTLMSSAAVFGFPEGKRVRDYMSDRVVCIEPHIDIFRISDLLMRNGFERVPVVKNGKLIGQVSRREILSGMERLRMEWARARTFAVRPQGLQFAKV